MSTSSDQQPHSPVRSRRVLWLAAAGLTAVLALIIAAAVGMAGQRAATTAPASGTPASSTVFSPQQQAYLDAVRRAGAPVGVGAGNSEADFVGLASRICAAAPGTTRSGALATLSFQRPVSEAVVDAALTHTCPGVSFLPDGPRTSFTDGTFVVGTDIAPGTYKTEGPYPRALPNCYWARLKGVSGELGDVITNGNTRGPTTVTIKPGDTAFKSNGCATWTKVK